MLTSEQQKIYNVKVPKGGYGYYTLYHGIYDPAKNIDERPSYAQTGDLFEPEGSSVVYKATRKNGKTTWVIDEDAQRQSESGEGGSGDGSLPTDFPAEGSANANKFLGFDSSGDYAALDAPSSGGAEKFVVTLTEDDGTWTADKTIAEIVAADESRQVVVASVSTKGVPYEIPLNFAIDGDMTGCAFSGTVLFELSSVSFVAVFGTILDDSDDWVVNIFDNRDVPSYSSSNNGQVLGVSSGLLAWVDSNAPLIVTMTADESVTGQFNGDKTYSEAFTAMTAGLPVTCVISGLGASRIIDATQIENTVFLTRSVLNASAQAELDVLSGSPSDYISVSLS